MAIAFDAATDGGNGASPFSFSHTTSGTNRVIFIMASTNSGVVPTATYAGVSATQVGTVTQGARTHTMFVLKDPAFGANNVVITASAGTVFGGATSYTGAGLSLTQPDSSATNSGASLTTITGTTTVIASNCWLICLAQCDGGGANISGGAGTTERARYGGFNQFSMLDSNGTVGTGSQSLVANSNTTADNMQIIVASLSPETTALKLNLVSYWKLDEASGNNADSVSSNTLTNNGSQTTGKINNGTSFSGSVKNVKASPSGFPSGNTDRSISGWYNFSSISNTSGTETWLTGFGSQGATGQEFYITLRGTGTATRFQADIYGEAASGTVDTGLTTGGWHHIALVYTASGTSWAYYLDGALKDTITKANLNTAATPSEFNVGGRMTFGQYFTGVADEIGIWSRALTSGEITTLYNSGTGLQYPFSASSSTVFHNFGLLGVGT